MVCSSSVNYASGGILMDTPILNLDSYTKLFSTVRDYIILNAKYNTLPLQNVELNKAFLDMIQSLDQCISRENDKNQTKQPNS